MDLEQRLRASLVAPDPGAEFTDSVMARMGDAPSPGRGWRLVSLGRGARRRRRSRFILLGTIAVMGAAAAIVAWRLREVPSRPVVTQIPAIALVTAKVVASPAMESAVAAPLVGSRQSDATTSAVPEAPTARSVPTQKDPAPRYTLIATLGQESQDPTAQAAARKFFNLLLNELRKAPGVILRVQDGADVALADTDYHVTITSLTATVQPNGSLSYRGSVTNGSLNGKTINDAPVPLELKVEQGGQAGPKLILGSPIMLGREDASRPAFCSTSQRSLFDSSMSSLMEFGRCLSMEQFAQKEAEMLRIRALPPDSAMRQQLQARIGIASMSERDRTDTLASLLGAARRQTGGRTLQPDEVAAIVGLAAELPSVRAMVWGMVRGFPDAAFVAPLLDSLGNDADDPSREAALNTLIADYGDEPRVRAALAVVVQGDRSELLRRVASRALSGEAQWRSYVLSALGNTDLPVQGRVEPLLYSSQHSATSAAQAAMKALLNDKEIVQALMSVARENWVNNSVESRGPLRRALNLLMDLDNQEILQSKQQELQEILDHYSVRVQLGMPRLESQVPLP